MMILYLEQIFNGLVSGAFIALMSLGLSIIFGMMRVVNFAHGSLYMLGAFAAFLAGTYGGLPLFASLVVAGLLVGGLGVILERLLISRLYRLDPAYNLLLTFGLALIIEDLVRSLFGVTGAPFLVPAVLQGAVHLGFMYYPKYRLFIVAVSALLCLVAWFLLERTRLGAMVRAATERPDLLKCFGANVPLLISGTFFAASALAGVAGALAAPIRDISPFMGDEMIALTFAVVVAGGMGSIAGSVLMGFIVGVLSSLTTIWYPAGSDAIVYVLMLLVLVVRPGGIFRGVDISHFPLHYTPMTERVRARLRSPTAAAVALAAGVILPWLVYPIVASDILLWGLCALGFDLLFASAGLLSFGQAAYWGMAAYITGVLISHFAYASWAGVVIGVIASTMIATAFGFVIARKKGIYFSMITFAFNEVVYFAANQLSAYTGGEDGLHGIQRGRLFGLNLADDRTFYYLCLVIAALVVVFVFALLRSPFGLSLTGARENERRMTSIGYNVYLIRVQAYAVSAFIISVGGALYALNHQFVSLDAIDWHASGQPVMMTLLGGVGTIYGPFLGAGVVIILQNTLSTITSNGSLVLGCLFVSVVMLFRRGVVGELMHVVAERRPRRAGLPRRPPQIS